MRLAVSMGNTNAAWGLFAGKKLVRGGRAPLSDLPGLPKKIGMARIESAALASVVPTRNKVVISAIAGAYGVRTLVAGKDLPVRIKNRCNPPSKVGVDRLLNGIAAYARAKGPCIVIDIGTAITVNAVAADGAFLGGAIAAGPETMLRALHDLTEQLPSVSFRKPRRAIGTNTHEAMRSGAYWGTIGMIESLVAKVAAELPRKAPVFLTGGGAEFFARDLAVKARLVPFLTLEGLNIAIR